MSKVRLKSKCTSILILGFVLSISACAERPVRVDHDHETDNTRNRTYEHDDDRQSDRHRHEDDRFRGDKSGSSVSVSVYFGDRHRAIVHEYYTGRYRSAGHCPPGLAKKRNGCLPPGQAKKWRRGYPVPRDVVFYDLPPRLIVELGVPPSGHRYVRVAADILLIAIGTSIVVDAIEDLGNR